MSSDPTADTSAAEPTAAAAHSAPIEIASPTSPGSLGGPGSVERSSLDRKDAMTRPAALEIQSSGSGLSPPPPVGTPATHLGSVGSLEAMTPASQPGVLAGVLGTQGWIMRAHSRTTDLCKWFGLPLNETLLDEFHCALRKRVLLQGRMYVFDHYVCFSSNVFGFVKRKVMPFSDIVAVRKKTHLRFPNSIEIELLPRATAVARKSLDSTGSAGGMSETAATGASMNEREFFTSFLSREDAYRLVFNCWSQVKPELAAAAQESHRQKGRALQQQDSGMSEGPASSGVLGGMSSLLGGVSKLLTAGGGQPPGRRISTLEYVEGNSDGSRAAPGMLRTGRRTESVPGIAPGAFLPTITQSPGGTVMTETLGGAQTAGSGGDNMEGIGKLSAARYSRDDEDEDDEGDEGSSSVIWAVVEPHAAPSVGSDARVVLSAVLPGSPRDFFDTLLADSSHLLEDFYEAQGNRRINLTPWKRHEQLGHVRDISFVAPIKGAFGNWGVSHTQCYQSHRFCQYQREHLVFESSQTMTDIPYGDCFTVDVRWDIKPHLDGEAGEDRLGPLPSPFNGGSGGSGGDLSGGGFSPSQVLVEITVRVPFTRRCLFKKVIESGTQKQVTETYCALVEELRRGLEEVASQKPGAPRVTHGQVPGGLASMPSMRHMGDASNDIHTPRTRSSFLHRVPSQLQNADMAGGAATPGAHAQQPGGRGVIRLARAQVASGLGGVWDFFMGVLSDSMSPQLRTLTIAVLCVFVVQVIMCFAVVRNQPRLAIASTPAPTPAVLPPLGGADLAEGWAHTYWSQRMGLLNAELSLLQQRMEAVAREMQLVAQYAQAGGAAASHPGAKPEL